VDQYIGFKMNSSMKRDQLNIVCMHIKSKLVDWKKEYSHSIVGASCTEDTEKCEVRLSD